MFDPVYYSSFGSMLINNVHVVVLKQILKYSWLVPILDFVLCVCGTICLLPDEQMALEHSAFQPVQHTQLCVSKKESEVVQIPILFVIYPSKDANKGIDVLPCSQGQLSLQSSNRDPLLEPRTQFMKSAETI